MVEIRGMALKFIHLMSVSAVQMEVCSIVLMGYATLPRSTYCLSNVYPSVSVCSSHDDMKLFFTSLLIVLLHYIRGDCKFAIPNDQVT